MKRSEVSIIIVIVIVSLTIAVFVGRAVLGATTQKGVAVQTEDRISGTVTQPDKTIFYSGAQNPTVPITIGNSSNQQPLSGAQ